MELADLPARVRPVQYFINKVSANKVPSIRLQQSVAQPSQSARDHANLKVR